MVGRLQHTSEQVKYLGMALDVLYTTIEADFNKNTDDGFYLNDTRYVGLVGTLSKRRSIRIRMDDPVDTPYSAGYTCELCDEHVSEDNLTYIECENRNVCSYCLDEHYRYVSHGHYDGFYPVDDVVEIYIPQQGRFLGGVWNFYLRDDSDVVEVDDEWYLKDDDRLIVDEYGTYVIANGGYAILENGEVYPEHDCKLNEKGVDSK
jgi:hypothetical protein